MSSGPECARHGPRQRSGLALSIYIRQYLFVQFDDLLTNPRLGRWKGRQNLSQRLPVDSPDYFARLRHYLGRPDLIDAWLQETLLRDARAYAQKHVKQQNATIPNGKTEGRSSLSGFPPIGVAAKRWTSRGNGSRRHGRPAGVGRGLPKSGFVRIPESSTDRCGRLQAGCVVPQFGNHDPGDDGLTRTALY